MEGGIHPWMVVQKSFVICFHRETKIHHERKSPACFHVTQNLPSW